MVTTASAPTSTIRPAGPSRLFQALQANAVKTRNVQYARRRRWPVVSRIGAVGGRLTACVAWTAISPSGYRRHRPYAGRVLLPLTNTPRPYAWGSTTLLARLQGRGPTGRPEAELWFGAHPGAPSTVADGTGRTLDRWLADQSRGESVPLPYLLKLLAIAHPLSIQAHPSKEQAAAGFAREEAAGIARDAPERSYRDDNHKPELIVAVSETFRALVGLREVAATRRLLDALGDAPGVRAVRDRLAEGGAAPGALPRSLVPWLLSAAAAETVADVRRALRDARSDEFHRELELAR